MKLKSLLFMTAAVLALSACGSTQKDSSSSKVDSSATSLESQSQVDSSSENAQVAAAKLVQGYSSPAQFKYQNMRPTYNYYTTTFSFESLDLYDDGTYQLNNISMTFSGIVLPEEGSDGSGNERENTVTRYYGTYSSEVDDLDADTTHISLSVPDRVVVFGDASVFYDTANWTDKMSAKAGETQQYDANYNVVIVPGEKSALEFLKERAFSAVTIDAVPNDSKIEYATLTVPEGGNQQAVLGTYNDGLNGGYSSPSQFKYQNMRPTYNYYTTTFSMQTLETYENGKYAFNEYSSTFSGVVLPEEGNDGSGNERENLHLSSYGTFTSQVDDLDEDTTHISLSESTRLVVRHDASSFYDTENWTAKMSAKAGETQQYDANYNVVIVPGEKSAETYLSENKKSAVVADVIPNNAKLDFVTFTD